jgi:hypothetical protein
MYISSKSEASSVALKYQNVRSWEMRAGATVRDPEFSEQVLLRVEVPKILITPRFLVCITELQTDLDVIIRMGTRAAGWNSSPSL